MPIPDPAPVIRATFPLSFICVDPPCDRGRPFNQTPVRVTFEWHEASLYPSMAVPLIIEVGKVSVEAKKLTGRGVGLVMLAAWR